MEFCTIIDWFFKKEQCSGEYVTENKYMTQLGCQCQTARPLSLDD
jgi:hypothetical protein